MELTLHLEPDPGSHIKNVAVKAVDIANRLDICVEFKFNSVTCICYPSANPADMEAAYHNAIEKTNFTRIAIIRRPF